MQSCEGATFYFDRESDGTLCSSFGSRAMEEECVIGRSADFVSEVLYVVTFAITIAMTQFSSSMS